MSSTMRMQRKHGGLLAAIAVWNVITWSRFIVALVDDHGQRTAFYVAHTMLIVVNFVIAIVLGAWAWRILRPGAQQAGDQANAERTSVSVKP